MPILSRRRRYPSSPAAYAASVGGGAWTPISLGSALRIWIKADAGLTVTSGQVDAAADQSGNSFNLTGTGANRPFYNATGSDNGRPTIDFDTPDQTFITSAVNAYAMGSTSSWFCMLQLNVSSAFNG